MKWPCPTIPVHVRRLQHVRTQRLHRCVRSLQNFPDCCEVKTYRQVPSTGEDVYGWLWREELHAHRLGRTTALSAGPWVFVVVGGVGGGVGVDVSVGVGVGGGGKQFPA